MCDCFGFGRANEYKQENIWDTLEWNDLNTFCKKQWTVLGYDQGIWDSGSVQTHTEGLDWARLAVAEQRAAGAMGYDEAMWNEGRNPSVMPTSASCPECHGTPQGCAFCAYP